MGLRRQLMLLGSLSLALPWAGLQYLREMESTLRHGHALAMASTSQAIAARLSSDSALLGVLGNAAQTAPKLPENVVFEDIARAIYVHSIPSALLFDGYDDDWRALDLSWQKADFLGPSVGSAQLIAARSDERLHLLLNVVDHQRQFYNPATNIVGADHILLRTLSSQGVATAWRLYTAAPGPVIIESLNASGQWQRDYRLQAIWNEREDSYTIEMELPFDLSAQALAIVAVSADPGDQIEGIVTQPLRLVVGRKPQLDQVLNVFSPAGARLYLVNQGGWVIGQAGDLQQPQNAAGFEEIQRQAIRKVLGQSRFLPLQLSDKSGAFSEVEIQPAFNGKLVQNWYRQGAGLVGRTLMPVLNEKGKVVAAVIAEQTTDSLDQLTSGAAGRLLIYSMVASLFAVVGLLVFASILSYRVRRLSRQAQAAVDSDGRILATFTGSASKDELGDLSRQYAALLQRLRSYTQYLESLASRLSHELRTPLAIVKGSLDNLGQTPLPDEAEVYLERARVGSDRLSVILNAMSAAARLEQTIQNNEKEPVDLRDLLPQLADAYRDAYQIPLTLNMLGEGSSYVCITADLWAQMLDKLMANAVDFRAADTPIEWRAIYSGDDVTLQVINTGQALDESMMESIFDPLFSARKSVSDEYHLGLGLYIVRMICQFHNAKLRVFNDKERGQVVFEVVIQVAV